LRGRLLLQKKDPSHQAWVLARMHRLPQVLLIGWVWGYQGKNQEYWLAPDGKRPCYTKITSASVGTSENCMPSWAANARGNPMAATMGAY
jgi:hypothetical protein